MKMLIEEINKCKISINSSKSNIKDLEEKLQINQRNTDIVRYSCISLVVASFILSFAIYLFSLLLLLPVIPGFFIFMNMDSKSDKIKQEINKSKQSIEFNETLLENLLNRQETLEKMNENKIKMQNSTYKAPPIRVNIRNKSNIYTR